VCVWCGEQCVTSAALQGGLYTAGALERASGGGGGEGAATNAVSLVKAVLTLLGNNSSAMGCL
jgi:hypothetical protein